MRAFEHNFDYFQNILLEAPFQKGLSIISYFHQQCGLLPSHMEDSRMKDGEWFVKSVKVWNWKTQRMSDKGIKETKKGREFIKDAGKTLYLDEFSKNPKCLVKPFEVEQGKWYYNMVYKFENGKLYEKYISSRHERYGFESYNTGVNGNYNLLTIGGYDFLNVRRCEVIENEFVELKFEKVWENL